MVRSSGEMCDASLTAPGLEFVRQERCSIVPDDDVTVAEVDKILFQ